MIVNGSFISAVIGCVWLWMVVDGCVMLCMAVYCCVWLCIVVYGCVLLCMAVYCCVWLCIVVYGCVLLCMAVYDCVLLCIFHAFVRVLFSIYVTVVSKAALFTCHSSFLRDLNLLKAFETKLHEVFEANMYFVFLVVRDCEEE